MYVLFLIVWMAGLGTSGLQVTEVYRYHSEADCAIMIDANKKELRGNMKLVCIRIK